MCGTRKPACVNAPRGMTTVQASPTSVTPRAGEFFSSLSYFCLEVPSCVLILNIQVICRALIIMTSFFGKIRKIDYFHIVRRPTIDIIHCTCV